jgi:hypothetical protein
MEWVFRVVTSAITRTAVAYRDSFAEGRGGRYSSMEVNGDYRMDWEKSEKQKLEAVERGTLRDGLRDLFAALYYRFEAGNIGHASI